MAGSALFDRFWAAYPRRTAKKAARKAFDRIGATPELVDRMVAALEAQQQQPQWQKDDGQFIPHASTWLNGERWEDEVDVAVARPVSRRTSKLVDASRRFMQS